MGTSFGLAILQGYNDIVAIMSTHSLGVSVVDNLTHTNQLSIIQFIM